MATELEIWEKRLKDIFNEINDILEEKYGSQYPLNPVRPRHGVTSNREDDGLFDVGAAFSAGFGSLYGEGYVIEIRWATLRPVPDETRKEAESIAEAYLNKRLPEEFPGKNLKVVHDGSLLKIIGNLKLG